MLIEPDETFVDVIGYECNYKISSDGTVYSKSHYNYIRQLTHIKTKKTIYRLSLMGKVKSHFVEDLIKQHFP